MDESVHAVGRQAVAHDWVDQVLADWHRTLPDLDTRPAGIIARVGRLTVLLDSGLERLFRDYALSRADFDVLATLRRSGSPYKLHQKVLMRQLMRTSGTISVRIDSLERRGLVQREPDQQDRRDTIVALTDAGITLIEQLVPLHIQNEEQLLHALNDAEREQLSILLRRLLISLELNQDLPSPHDLDSTK